MSRTTPLLSLALGLSLIACEPPDGGGGGGIGGRLALIRDGALITALDDGSDERTLTDPYTSADPALSPSGGTIAFAYSEEGDDLARGLYLVGTSAGARLDALVEPDPGEGFSTPAWSPDGAEIVFVVTSGPTSTLRLVDASNGEGFDLPDTERLIDPAWLDGDTLLVRHGVTQALLTYSLDDASTTELGETSVSRPSVAPGGGLIAWTSGAPEHRIHLLDLDTQAQRTLSPAGVRPENPCFSFDASFIAFESDRRIYALALDDESGAVPELLQSGVQVSWSP